jgi:hypothetical protein
MPLTKHQKSLNLYLLVPMHFKVFCVKMRNVVIISRSITCAIICTLYQHFPSFLKEGQTGYDYSSTDM